MDAIQVDAVRMLLVGECQLVDEGMRAMLQPFTGRVRIEEADADVVLFDPATMEGGLGAVASVQAAYPAAQVLLYSWKPARETVRRGLEQGVRGCVPKSLPAERLVEAVERVHAGELVVEGVPGLDPRDVRAPVVLTRREAEVLGLICQGISNGQIAEKSCLSVNSVKSYIRSAYRKMGVTSRTQAILWALEHGYATEGADPPLGSTGLPLAVPAWLPRSSSHELSPASAAG